MAKKKSGADKAPAQHTAPAHDNHGDTAENTSTGYTFDRDAAEERFIAARDAVKDAEAALKAAEKEQADAAHEIGAHMAAQAKAHSKRNLVITLGGEKYAHATEKGSPEDAPRYILRRKGEATEIEL